MGGIRIMKKYLILISIFISTLLLHSSVSKWSTLNQDPYQVWDISSIYAYPTTMLDAEALKTDILFDYYPSNLQSMVSFQGESGRVGIFIKRISDIMTDSLFLNISGKNNTPVYLGIVGAKTVKNTAIGIAVTGYAISDSYIDENSQNSVSFNMSEVAITPSVSINLLKIYTIEVAPDIIVKTGSYSDFEYLNELSGTVGYRVKARILQRLSENDIIVFGNYSSIPYSYRNTAVDETIDNTYNITNDSLRVGFIFALNSFSYVKPIISAMYEKKSTLRETIFSSGSSTEEYSSSTVLPQIGAGAEFYATKNFSLLVGANAKWKSYETQSAPSLSPITQTGSFEWDFRTGASFTFENLSINIDMSKEFVQMPYFISGNVFANTTMGIGIRFSGYEY